MHSSMVLRCLISQLTHIFLVCFSFFYLLALFWSDTRVDKEQSRGLHLHSCWTWSLQRHLHLPGLSWPPQVQRGIYTYTYIYIFSHPNYDYKTTLTFLKKLRYKINYEFSRAIFFRQIIYSIYKLICDLITCDKYFNLVWFSF